MFSLSYELKRFAPLERPSVLYAPFNIPYRKATFANWTFSDLSFGVFSGDQCLSCALLTRAVSKEGARALNWYGIPATAFDLEKLPKAAATMFRNHLAEILRQNPDCAWRFREYSPAPLSLGGKIFLEQGAVPEAHFLGYVDLRVASEEIWQTVRKSYRPLIARSREILSQRIISAENVRPEDLEAFRILHREVAGRSTRGEASWQAQYDLVHDGHAFLVFSYLHDSLVGASFYLLDQNSCYYGVGAYRRDLFAEIPVSHGALWEAILYAKAQGARLFELGQVFFPAEPALPGAKEYNIGVFKKGFSESIRTCLNLSRRPKE